MGLIIDFFCITVLITGLLRIKDTYRLWPMLVFLTASEITNIALYIPLPPNTSRHIYMSFIIVEAGCFVIFFKDILKLKQFLFIVACALLLLFVFINIRSRDIAFTTFVRVSPPILIVFGCTFYFFNLLRETYSGSPAKSPHFWIVAGASLHFLLSFPSSFFNQILIDRYLLLETISSITTEFSYLILYLCIFKAFLCKTSN
ncbi:MAG: hypothetical protein IPK31_03295 [Chitinophagaceae bacterium]|nr:hypothetical protein [Chitinophagaceae bacterium]